MLTSFLAGQSPIPAPCRLIHVLLHEIRHWAQIATLLRMTGVTDGFHDILFSPALGGEVKT